MINFLNVIKQLIEESNEEWFERHCYIQLDALVTKAKSSPQFKQIELADSLQVEDGRYITAIDNCDIILLKLRGKCVFIYAAPWGRQILTNANQIQVNTIFNHYGKVNASGLFTILKTSIAFSGNPLQRITLFHEPTLKSASRPKDQLGDFFTEVLGRPLTHMEKGFVNILKDKMAESK